MAKRVLALALVLGAVLFLVLRESGTRRPRPVLARPTPAEGAEAREEGTLSAPGPGLVERAEAREDEPESLPEASPLETQGDYDVREDATGNSTVVLRVRVLGPGREPVPRIDVRTQTWLTDSGETLPFTERTGADGVATFTFDGFTHVDWLIAAPARSSGLGATMIEFHEDLEPGSVMDAVLELAPGADVTGRIELTDGRPAVGVEVHAYVEYYEGELSNTWRPGLFTAVSDARGVFFFDCLPAYGFGFAVPPFEWLQVQPTYEDGYPNIELASGKETDLGVLRVEPLHALELLLENPADADRPDVNAWLEPIEFASPEIFLRLEAEDESSTLERWLGGTGSGAAGTTEDSIAWGYEVPAVRFVEGRARLPLPAGTYELSLIPENAPQVADRVLLKQRVVVPCPPQTLHIEYRSFAVVGVVVDPEGARVPGARVALESHDPQWRRSWQVKTDENGRFAFGDLPPGYEFTLVVRHPSFVPSEYRVHAGDPEREYALEQGTELVIRLIDTEGNPVGKKPVWLVAGEPRGGYASLTESERTRLERINAGGQTFNSDRQGRLVVPSLVAGTYELVTKLPYARDDTTPGWGFRNEWRVHQRWRLPTGPDEHVLTIDERDWSPPQRPSMVRHEGTVRDAITGRPIHARIQVQADRGRTTTYSDASDGSFGLNFIGGTARLVSFAPGYEILSLPEANYAPGEYAHTLAMTPSGAPIELRVVDSDDVPLQAFGVGLEDPMGRPLEALLGSWNLSSRIETVEGSVAIGGLAPGLVVVRLDLFEVLPLGAHTIEVVPGAEPQVVTIELEQTVDELRAAVREVRAREAAANGD